MKDNGFSLISREKAAECSKKNPPHSPYQIEEILILGSSFSDGFDKMIKQTNKQRRNEDTKKD